MVSVGAVAEFEEEGAGRLPVDGFDVGHGEVRFCGKNWIICGAWLLLHFFKKKNNLRCEVCDFPEVEVRVRSKMRIAMFVNRSLKSRVK